MGWGDDGLIVEAAAENAFDFKDGSPLDPDYKLRLHLIKQHLKRKRIETLTLGLMLHNAILCTQRTLADAEDVNGDSVRLALNQFIDVVSGEHISKSETSQLTPEEQIALYRERYKQEYGG